MELFAGLAGLFLAHLVALASPGPAFIIVLQQAAARSRSAGLSVALGVALGSLTWIALVLLGVGLVLQEASCLYGTLRLVGGLYLIYLAVRMWRGAGEPLTFAIPPEVGTLGWPALRRGLLTQLLNPKAAIFFGSIYVTFLPPDLPHLTLVAVAVAIVLVELFWYVAVALAFSAKRVHQTYAAAKTWIDRVAGGCLALLGAKLMLSDR